MNSLWIATVLLFTIELHANDLEPIPKIVWSGPTDNQMFKALKQGLPELRHEDDNSGSMSTVAIRAMSGTDHIEVRNKKSNTWVEMKVPKDNSSGTIDAQAVKIQSIWSASCDLVKTEIRSKKSTPKTKIYFNSRPIGVVEQNGRFFYESKGVCRGQDVELLGSLKECDDFIDSFRPKENPHVYIGSFVPDCSKLEVSK